MVGFVARRVSGVQCNASVSLKPSGPCKEWLTSPCHPLPVNPSKPVPICGAVVQPGHVVAHASHVLWMFRGLFFCNRCGMYGSTKFKLLGVQCKLPTTHGKRALKAIRDCKLPSGLACRPVLNVQSRPLTPSSS